MRPLRERITAIPRLADWLALLGGLIYAAQAFVYMFTSRSMLDEGLYLVKGWYFATGVYTPFQDYGVLTNHMPLAFLIPGYVLKWFGATLLTGRLFAVLVSLAFVLAAWLVARRLGGGWWGVAVVWALALNVAQVRIYSLGLSQGLVAALIAWMLWLSLRRQVSPMQVAAAGLLAGVMVMVRINMLPLAGLWLLYVLWQHGWKPFWVGAGTFAVVFLGVHAAFWPNILRMWAYWVPKGLIPALEPFYTPWDKYTGLQVSGWEWLTDLDATAWNPIISFWQALRFNFVAVTGFVVNLLLWPRRKDWPDAFTQRAAIFLNVAFGVLLVEHMWAALGEQSCTGFCFSGYLTFFSLLGLLAVVVTAPSWRKQLHWAHQLLILLVLLLLGAGIGFGAADKLGKFLAELPVPRPSGSAPLWGYFENKLGVPYRDARKILPALAGLGFALLLVAGAWWARRRWISTQVYSLLGAALLGAFLLGTLLSPTPLFSLGDENLKCGGNLIGEYAEVGPQLAALMQPGESLYYQGPNSPAILLYLPGVTIYPPQLNNVFSFSTAADGPDADTLLKFGYWDEELKQHQIGEADLVLLEARRYAEWQPLVEAGVYDTVFVSEALEPCRGKDSAVVLLRQNN